MKITKNKSETTKTESQMRQNKTPRIMQHITTKPKSAHYFKRDNSEDQ